MKVRIEPITSWQRVLNAARYTAHLEPKDSEPSEKWVRRMLIAQHSPIRLKEYDITLEGVPYWVMVHLVRHKVGVEFFVQTSRDDRRPADGASADTFGKAKGTGATESKAKSRAEMPQGAPINMRMAINAQALITMAEMRLCNKASKETRDVLRAIKDEMQKVDPVMASVLVPRCVRCGFCPELKCCGWVRSEAIEDYRTGA